MHSKNVVMLSLGALQAWDGNPRQLQDRLDARQGIEQLTKDLKKRGCLVPLLVKPPKDGRHLIVDGNRRYAAALLAGTIKELPCILIEGDVTPEQALELALVTSFHKQDLTPQEKVHGFLELMRSRPGATAKEICELLSIDVSLATRYTAYERALPAVQSAFDQNKFGLKTLYEISKSETEDEQRKALDKALGGAAAEEMAHERRKSLHQGNGESKLHRLKLLVPGTGAAITIAGKNLTLDAGIEAVSLLLREMKKAAESGLSGKTLEKALKDRAKGVTHAT